MANRPKPTAVKKLEGNPGKRRMPKPGEEPEPKPLFELPDPPEWMGDAGVREWNRVGPVLIENRLLSEADIMLFTAYCLNVQMMVDSYVDIEDMGMTIIGARGKTRNPALASFAAATTALRSLAAEFGMSPSSRSRIKLPGDDGESLADLLNLGGDEEPE